MRKQKKHRPRSFDLRLGYDEYQILTERKKNTTCGSMSEYLRRVLLNEPVTGYIRNKSLDEFMTELILLRKELKVIGDNFNLAVRALHTCDTISEVKAWLLVNEDGYASLATKMEEIKVKINSIADQWLQ